MSELDFTFLGYTLAGVGLFFICCAVLQKKPKHILEEAFGVSSGVLRELKSSVFKKNQLVLGYACILLAICLNVFSHTLVDSSGGSILDSRAPVLLVVAFVTLVAVICGILNYLSRLFSKWHFRKIVTEVVTERNLPFETNIALAVEIGQILGVAREDTDSVDQYLGKMRKHLDLPEESPESRSRRSSRIGLEFR